MKIAKICKIFEKQQLSIQNKSAKRIEKAFLTPAKRKTPLSQTSTQRLKLTLQQYILENKELKIQSQELRSEMEKPSLPAGSNLNDDLRQIQIK